MLSRCISSELVRLMLHVSTAGLLASVLVRERCDRRGAGTGRGFIKQP